MLALMSSSCRSSDVDYEDEPAMNKANGAAEQWLVTFTQALRSQLPQGQYILTHAREYIPSPCA